MANKIEMQRCVCSFTIKQTDGSLKWYLNQTGLIKNCTSQGLFYVHLDNPIDPGTDFSVYDVYVKPENLTILGQ